MQTLRLKQIDMQKAAGLLLAGEVVAFPTETVFGLGVVYDDETAFQKLVNAKRRRGDKPFTLMCADPKDIAKYALVDEKAQRLIDKFMPGPLTIIVPIKSFMPTWVSFSTGYVGVRISSLDFVRDLIRRVGKPLLVPSANHTDQAPALDDKTVLAIFDNEISAVIEGRAISAKPSTIVEIKDKIKLIREGEIPFDEIMKVYEGTL